jgi:hypothetical protein
LPRPSGDVHIDVAPAFFDELAALTTDPDAGFAELTARYQSDPRLTVPATVRNAVLNRIDAP